MNARSLVAALLALFAVGCSEPADGPMETRTDAERQCVEGVDEDWPVVEELIDWATEQCPDVRENYEEVRELQTCVNKAFAADFDYLGDTYPTMRFEFLNQIAGCSLADDFDAESWPLDCEVDLTVGYDAAIDGCVED